jgi:GMP synthase (glutamine-hydrolysing)
MICYVDIEHKKVLQDEEKRRAHLVERADIKLRLEEISGEPCLVQHYSRVTRQRLREWGVQVMIIGLNRTSWADYDDADLAEMYRIVRAAELPIIGLCGGCQLIARAHGAPVGPIRRLQEGEEDSSPDYGPGYFKEWGFTPVRVVLSSSKGVVQSDPLFDGLGEEPVFHQEHYWEIKETPPHFEVLASTDECQVQVIKHVEKVVYGTQFHPERYTEEQPDGRRLLINFFKLAGILE